MQLGAYELISKIGAGGMGEVWRAEDSRLLRPVAIKILSEGIASDPEWKARFLREARTIAQVNHPNIATIYSIEQEGPTLFIVMELIEGESLTEIIARGPMPVPEAIRIIHETAQALVEAHAKGIVHRDVKPDNILVAKRHVKVVDFGIAKNVEGTIQEDEVTSGGVVMGTPFYMSPEQALAKPIDKRTDIFALGVVLFEALTGRRPFVGQTVTETIMHIIMNPAPEITEILPRIPHAVAAIVRRALAKKPEDRFQTMSDLAFALEQIDLSRRGAKDTNPVPMSQEGTPTTPLTGRRPPEVAPVVSLPKVVPLREGQRALVADDDPVTRHLIGSALARNGVAFDEVSNGADAVKFLKKNKYTLVFLDLLMPRIDGWGVLDFIRTRREEQPHLFIVTGVKDQTFSEVDRDVVTAVIYKPLDVLEVDKLVQEQIA